MHIRAKLAWITLTTLALSVEGGALADSAPAHGGSSSDPSVTVVQQKDAPVGPELAAALASLAGTTKRSDNGASVDLNRLGNRRAAAGDTVASGLVLPSAAGASIQAKPGGGGSLQMLQGAATGATSTDAGPATRVVPVGDIQQGGASTALHPETVIRGQINPAARSCYANGPDSTARRPGKMVILIKLTPAGGVDSVNVAINVGVSPSVATCVTTAARAATFAPPGANGATIPAAFTFPGQADPAPPAAAPVKGSDAPSASGHAHETPVEVDAQPTSREAPRQ
jgi:hypothetical protein